MNDDPVIAKYLRGYVDKIESLRKGGRYKIGNITISTPVRHEHRVETYGLVFKSKRLTLSYITDTRYFKKLPTYYKGSDVLVISVLREKVHAFDHLCVDDAKEIIRIVRPKLAIMTHFGRFMLAANPEKIAKELSKELKTKVIAAKDGMKVRLDHCGR